jgi:hypothetical protein
MSMTSKSLRRHPAPAASEYPHNQNEGVRPPK